MLCVDHVELFGLLGTEIPTHIVSTMEVCSQDATSRRRRVGLTAMYRGVVLTAMFRGVVLTAMFRGVVLTTILVTARARQHSARGTVKQK